MGHDYDVQLRRNDGSVRNFRIYGETIPKDGDVITLPVDGQVVKARIDEPQHGSEISRSVEQAKAVEV